MFQNVFFVLGYRMKQYSVVFCCLMIGGVLTAFTGPSILGPIPLREGNVISSRVRRAMPDFLTAILKTAWVKYSSKDYMQYKKLGNYKDAKRDFRRLNPTEVTKEGQFIRGRIGDTFLELHNAVRPGQKNRQGADTRIYFNGGNENVKQLSIQYVPKH